MLRRLSVAEYAALKGAHRASVERYPLINALLEAMQAGFVFATEQKDPFFACTKSGFSLLHAGKATMNGETLFRFLTEAEDIPEYIHLYSPPRSLTEFVTKHWAKHKLRRRAQFRLLHRRRAFQPGWVLPPGCACVPLCEVDLERLNDALQLELHRRYWDSAEDFRTKAFGACILNESNEPIAICYSACMVDGIAEIDVFVSPAYRGKHLAGIVAQRFLELAEARGLIPHWDTFVHNVPSYGLAQKLELAPTGEYDLLSILLR